MFFLTLEEILWYAYFHESKTVNLQWCTISDNVSAIHNITMLLIASLIIFWEKFIGILAQQHFMVLNI